MCFISPAHDIYDKDKSILIKSYSKRIISDKFFLRQLKNDSSETLLVHLHLFVCHLLRFNQRLILQFVT